MRSDTAGMISKGAGDKVQKHLPVMGVIRHRSKRNVLYAMMQPLLPPPSSSTGTEPVSVSLSEAKEAREKSE